MLPGEHDILESDPDHQRQDQKPDAGVEQMVADHRPGQKDPEQHPDHDPERQHHEEEAGPAAGVEARVLLGVRGGQLVARLVAGDALVLRAVVLKGAADVGHQRNQY